MLIQCVIERQGNTVVTYQSKAYEFKPDFDRTGNDSDKVCEVVPSHGQAHFLGMAGFKEWQDSGNRSERPQTPQEAKDLLTRELFMSTTNAPTLKSLIKKCGNVTLLNELGEGENSSLSKRPWVMEAINSRLNELEG